MIASQFIAYFEFPVLPPVLTTPLPRREFEAVLRRRDTELSLDDRDFMPTLSER